MPKKILIARLGAMGDVIHALPAATLLRRALPDARIGWVVERRWSELLEWKFRGRPFPDVVHKVDTRRWRKTLGSRPTRYEIWMALRELRSERYDVVLDFQGAIKSAFIGLISGAPRRFGFAEAWEKPASLFYTHPVISTAKHVVNQNRELVAEIAGHDNNPEIEGELEWAPHDSSIGDWFDSESARLWLKSGFAILNPGAGWGAKQWSTERYAEVARSLGENGLRSLINYGPGEEQLAKDVEDNSGGYGVAASFSISKLIAITRKASLFIGGDTGPMHLAAFLNVPVVAIFGPTDPARNGPYGTKSIVLRDPLSVTSHKRVKETEAGLRNITVEQVLWAARELLATGEGVRA